MRRVNELVNLKGRVAIVTGGAGHVGAAICDALAEYGANIVIIDCDETSCNERCNQIFQDYQVRTYPLVMDLANEAKLRNVPEIILKEFGSIDILVNCAALVGTSTLKGWGVRFADQDATTWRKALEINLTVPFILTQACAGALSRSQHGSVINIGSIYGVNGPNMQLYEGTTMGNPAAYAASKGGLIQLTRWLATVLSPNVRANAISLGGVYRGQPEPFLSRYINKTPLKRMASEEDIKGAVIYLASDMSSYVTGQNIVIDGGFTVW